MSGSVRIPDLPDLGTPTDASLFVADHSGTGVFAGAQVREFLLGGTVDAISVGALSVTTLDTSGNATVGGTLGVTGDTTLTDLSVSGTLTAGTISTAGTLTAGTANVTALNASGAIACNGIFADPDQFGMVVSGSDKILSWAPNSYEVRHTDGTREWIHANQVKLRLTTSGSMLLQSDALTLGGLADTFITLSGGDTFSTGTGGRSSLIINGGGRATYGFEFYTNGSRYVAFDVTGGAFKPGGGTWSDISDARIKQDVQDYPAGLSEVVQLRPVSYRFLPDTGRDQDKTYYGLIAQEAETVMPEMVTQGPADCGSLHFDDMRSLDTHALVFALVNAVKELRLRVVALETARGQPEHV